MDRREQHHFDSSNGRFIGEVNESTISRSSMRRASGVTQATSVTRRSTMINDEMRREAASALRALDTGGRGLVLMDSVCDAIGLYGCGLGGAYLEKEGVAYLADLIDRPTCTPVVSDGPFASCSNCHDIWLAGVRSYCPYCGAAVVR